MERVDPTVTSVAKALKRKYGPSSWDGQVPWERGSMKLVDDIDDSLYMSVVRIFTKDVCFTILGCTKPAEVFCCRIRMSSLLLNYFLIGAGVLPSVSYPHNSFGFVGLMVMVTQLFSCVFEPLPER